MIYYPIFLAPVLLALLVALRKPEWGFMAACALLPFGAGAVFILSALGNMTVLASAVAFGLLAPIVLLQPALERRALVLPKPEWPVAIMLLIAGWSVFSAFVMPRLFEGDVQVISYNRVLFVEGVRVSDRFITSLDSLQMWITQDSLMAAKRDSIFGSGFMADSLIYSPRTGKKFVYTVNDTSAVVTYLLEDPDSDDYIGTLSGDVTQLNAASWE